MGLSMYLLRLVLSRKMVPCSLDLEWTAIAYGHRYRRYSVFVVVGIRNMALLWQCGVWHTGGDWFCEQLEPSRVGMEAR